MNTNTGNNVKNTRTTIGGPTKLSKVEVSHMLNCIIKKKDDWKECVRLYNISNGLFYNIIKGKGAYKYLRSTDILTQAVRAINGSSDKTLNINKQASKKSKKVHKKDVKKTSSFKIVKKVEKKRVEEVEQLEEPKMIKMSNNKFILANTILNFLKLKLDGINDKIISERLASTQILNVSIRMIKKSLTDKNVIAHMQKYHIDIWNKYIEFDSMSLFDWHYKIYIDKIIKLLLSDIQHQDLPNYLDISFSQIEKIYRKHKDLYPDSESIVKIQKLTDKRKRTSKIKKVDDSTESIGTIIKSENSDDIFPEIYIKNERINIEWLVKFIKLRITGKLHTYCINELQKTESGNYTIYRVNSFLKKKILIEYMKKYYTELWEKYEMCKNYTIFDWLYYDRIDEIIKLLLTGVTQTEIGKKLEIDHSIISSIYRKYKKIHVSNDIISKIEQYKTINRKKTISENKKALYEKRADEKSPFFIDDTFFMDDTPLTDIDKILFESDESNNFDDSKALKEVDALDVDNFGMFAQVKHNTLEVDNFGTLEDPKEVKEVVNTKDKQSLTIVKKGNKMAQNEYPTMIRYARSNHKQHSLVWNISENIVIVHYFTVDQEISKNAMLKINEYMLLNPETKETEIISENILNILLSSNKMSIGDYSEYFEFIEDYKTYKINRTGV